jgi:hypothetical protein
MGTNEHELPSAALPSISEIPFPRLKLARLPTGSTLPCTSLPSISEIPFPRFLGSWFPDSKYLRDLRALRGEEIVSAVAPLQRMRSNGQAFKPTRRGDRSPISGVRAICGLNRSLGV